MIKPPRIRMPQLGRSWLPLLVAVVGVAASLAVWQALAAYEDRRVESRFDAGAEEHSHIVGDKIDEALDAVEQLAALYAASETVKREEFRIFTTPMLSNEGSIQALEWIPRVPAAQRDGHEEAARGDGFPQYEISERETQGQMVRAGERDEYFPVYFVEPYEGNERALGFDLGSQGTRLEGLNRARDSGEMTATGRITLVQEEGDQFGFLAFLPVYRKGEPVGTLSERRANLEGFVLGVYRVGDIVEGTLANLTSATLNVALFDDSAPPDERFLYAHVADPLEEADAAQLARQMQEDPSGLYHAATIEVGGRQWRVVSTPTEAFLASQRTWAPIGGLVAGLIVTALVAAYLVVTGQRRRAKEALRQRTHDLSERMKELKCLYGIAQLVERPGASLEEIAQGMADTIPSSWQYPEVTCARISVDGKLFRTDNFRETPWRQTAEIMAHGERIGAVEVCYLEERPESDEGPFLKEERRLINTIARQLGEVTERRRAKVALRESQERYRDLFENASDIIQSVARDGSYVYVNRAWRETLGYSEEESRSLNLFDIIHPDSRAHCMELFQRLMAGERLGLVEAKFVAKDGRSIWVEGGVFARLQDGKPVATRGIFRDVTERKLAEEAARHMAYHDALTDLPNRALFKESLAQALIRARRDEQTLTVMFLDLDRFKLVNDTAGHAEGDRMLRSVADRLKGLAREGDTVARVGGDEFLLLFRGLARVEDAAAVAERVLESFRRLQVLAGHEFHITASLGVTMYPSDGEDAETLLKNADIAMSRAKQEGRNNYQFYNPAMNTQIEKRLVLESDLRHALERGEFTVYYQPQVDVKTRQIVGVEALVRWQHPERGLVLPGEFIPVAEETGLIVPLGEWVLRTACAQNKGWQEAGFPAMRMAVNLSARQFQEPNLVDAVAQVLRETGLDPHYLQLEITEGTAIQDVDFTITVLRSLREMGVEIAIDDFGTGYSSLAYLQRFAIDVVKLDQSFVRDMTVDPSDAAITTTVIAMAHNLKLSVIAEGVETEEQLAFLEEHECDEMQGYLFSKPMPAEQIEKALAQGERPQVLNSSLKSR